MSDAPHVDDLLIELEREMDRQGSPFSSLAAPPVDARQLDEAEERVGIAFPAELRAWWLWHDGTIPPQGRLSAHEIGAGGWWPYPLEKALGMWRWWCKENVPSDAVFPRSWLPFAGAQSKWLNAKLEMSAADQLTLGVVTLPWDGEFGATAETTFPELIQGWIDFLREGHATWDADGVCWVYRWPLPAQYNSELFWG